jgi:methyl-accepting chemotaxis protein
MSLVLSIYLVVTVSFTGLLLNNLKEQILNELESQSNVLSFVFDAKKKELLSSAKLLSQNVENGIEIASENGDHDMLVIFDKDGTVTYRGEDTERKGDSISSDPLVKRIIEGQEGSNVVVKDGVVAPTIILVSGSPIYKDGEISGGVIVGDLIDEAYLNGFSKLTGLKAAVYGGDTLSAGGIIGAKETKKEVKEKVLIKGEMYSLENNWLNRSFLSVYSPIKNVEGNVIGMVFVGRPQSEVLDLASRTLISIFAGTIFLLIMSMIPAGIIANYINKQIQ